MPEGITWDELMEELEILADLRRADAEIDAGDFVTHEEVKQEIATWFPSSLVAIGTERTSRNQELHRCEQPDCGKEDRSRN